MQENYHPMWRNKNLKNDLYLANDADRISLTGFSVWKEPRFGRMFKDVRCFWAPRKTTVSDQHLLERVLRLAKSAAMRDEVRWPMRISGTEARL